MRAFAGVFARFGGVCSCIRELSSLGKPSRCEGEWSMKPTSNSSSELYWTLAAD